jgi:hypothetical protein
MSVPIEYLRRRVRPNISVVAGSALRNGGHENLLEIVFDDCHANDGIRDCERAVVGSRCGSKYHELPRLPAAASRIPTAIIATAPGRHSPKEVASVSALIGTARCQRVRRLPPPEERRNRNRFQHGKWHPHHLLGCERHPVGLGLVTSLNRPGGNLTGMSTLTRPRVAKGGVAACGNRNGLSCESIKPQQRGRDESSTCGSARSRNHAAGAERQHGKGTRRSFRRVDDAARPGTCGRRRALLRQPRQKIVDLAAKHAVATSYAWRENVIAGGLMSYGTNLAVSTVWQASWLVECSRVKRLPACQ